MKRKVSVCAGVMAAVVAFSAGAETQSGQVASSPVDDGAARAQGSAATGAATSAPPLVTAPATGTAVASVAAPVVVPATVAAASIATVSPTSEPAAPEQAAPEVAKANAPAQDEVHIPFSLTFVPGLSTAGLHTGNVVNNVSIGLLATHAKRVDGLAMSLGANWIKDSAEGAQMTVGLNYTGGDTSGAQLAVGANIVGGSMGGAQFSTGGNLVTGSMNGAQFTVGANLVSGGVVGGQMAAGANITTGHVKGFQMAVGANVATGGIRGLQAAAGANIAPEVSGAQLSSGISYAGRLSGAQISVINVGGDVDGAQVGIVNVARHVRGAQVGVVNVAGESEGEAVGMLSLVGNGQFHMQAWGSDIAMANVGLKLGGKHLYTLFAAGFNPGTDTRRRRYVFGAGFGGHIPLERFFIDVDLVGNSLHAESPFKGEGKNVLGQLRLIGGWQVARHFALYAGATGNTLVTWDDSDRWEDVGVGPEWRESSDNGRTRTRIWPGFLLGVQL